VRVRISAALLCLALAGTATLAQVPAPTNLRAERLIDAHCIALYWIDAALNEGSYEISRSDATHPLALVGTAPRNATTYTDCTLDIAVLTYSYEVRGTTQPGVGMTFGVTADTTYFNIESSLPTVPRVWGGRINGLPVSGYCGSHAASDPDDPVGHDCWWVFPDTAKHYRAQFCDAAGNCSDWVLEPHMRCGPIVPGGGCECAKYPSEPGCLP
jgi:hypothetical protein